MNATGIARHSYVEAREQLNTALIRLKPVLGWHTGAGNCDVIKEPSQLERQLLQSFVGGGVVPVIHTLLNEADSKYILLQVGCQCRQLHTAGDINISKLSR